MLNSLCVFCGSSSGNRPIYRDSAATLGRVLAAQGITLVYGGGNVGLMGVVADACLEAGGRVVGVIPQLLVDKEVAHLGLTELHVVGSMHERKALMADLAGAFLALPGGAGTFDEFFEILTWAQLGLHRKACGLLNVEGYYDPLLAMADHAVAEGFLRPAHRSMLLSDTDPVRMLDGLRGYEPPVVEKWAEPRRASSTTNWT
jgi:uncharacterized protein (TIGR00730 family)